MTSDLDVTEDSGLMSGLAAVGNADALELQLHSLASHRDRLSASVADPGRRLRWLLRRRKSASQRNTGAWTQACPACLAEDEVPYFRAWWRLAFMTECPIHATPLIDRCPQCLHVLDYGAGDHGTPRPQDLYSLSRCPRCATDWARNLRQASNVALVDGQRAMLRALSERWMALGPQHIWSGLFFDGCYRLLRELRRPPAGLRLAERLLDQDAYACLAVLDQQVPIEHLEIAPRRVLATLLLHVLSDWPRRFVDAALRTRFTLSRLRGDLGSAPYWLDAVGREWLDRRWHVTNAVEKDQAQEALRRRALPHGKMAVKALLGVSTPDAPNGLAAPIAPAQLLFSSFHVRDVSASHRAWLRRLAVVLLRHVRRGASNRASVMQQMQLEFPTRVT